jgi:hypothetical protein
LIYKIIVVRPPACGGDIPRSPIVTPSACYSSGAGHTKPNQKKMKLKNLVQFWILRVTRAKKQTKLKKTVQKKKVVELPSHFFANLRY